MKLYDLITLLPMDDIVLLNRANTRLFVGNVQTLLQQKPPYIENGVVLISSVGYDVNISAIKIDISLNKE